MAIETAKPKTACCFSGHRKIPAQIQASLRQRLIDGIVYLYSNMNITTFYTGGALGFDTLAAEAVIECRKQYPDIRLLIIVPCADQAAKWPMDDQIRYEHTKEAADEVVCLAEHYWSGCMHQRNQYLVDQSSVCICYLTEAVGGTAYTVNYARKQGLKIYNLAKPRA